MRKKNDFIGLEQLRVRNWVKYLTTLIVSVKIIVSVLWLTDGCALWRRLCTGVTRDRNVSFAPRALRRRSLRVAN